MKNKFTSRIPWREKLTKPQEPKLVKISPKMSHFGKGMMLWGEQQQARLLRGEGFKIVHRGKRSFVKDFVSR